jgi:2-oxoglutarate dehydrogenase E1 component
MKDYSYVFNAHPEYIDGLYQKYLQDEQLVEEGWRRFFEGFEFGSNDGISELEDSSDRLKEFGVMSIIHGFRSRGHLLSTTNPIRERRDRQARLNLNDYGLEDSDLDKPFMAGGKIGMPGATLDKILKRLNQIYTGNIGFEYTYIFEKDKRQWLRDKIESRTTEDDYGLSLEKKKRILEKLNGAVVFEKFLHTKYIGQKRFSLEGGESTIAALDSMIRKGADLGAREFVFGMAHRGRLNVLANILGKTYENIFSEFEGTAVPDLSFGDGDVKYHLGISSQVEVENGDVVDLKLVPNPSHLESVDPVVEGFSRAKADLIYDKDFNKIIPILIHGDAAVAGQGVVYETVQMSKLHGYYTGGTIHFVINNQIGFTTDWDDARSATYCTGVASMVQAPVFHVNGDDPEAVIWAVETAIEFRQKFRSDVWIDMVCYRRHGHNEGDDPKFTQPEMYDFINKHPNPREVYSKILIDRGDLQAQMAKDMEKKFWNELQERLELVKQKPLPYTYQQPEEAWRKLKKKTTLKDYINSPITSINKKRLDGLVKGLLTLPEDFEPLGKVNRLLKSKHKLVDAGKLDWAMAELLAYGSLLVEGKDVRMSGQDVKRGTFSHRHAIFYDKESFDEHNRLDDLGENQGRFWIYNSLLSEFAVLGFEYGYSMATPDTLVIWEGQFGDFYNGAQTIVDQYISSAESKWRRMSGLVLLLPHGYEGQGPEHSSGRVERFLQSCAEFNMTVANISTPANFFHLMRRQLYRPFRKPLIVMSPKSLLRHPECVSSFDAFTGRTRFQEVLDDQELSAKEQAGVKRLLMCSGKIYYDLDEYRKAKNRKDVAIVRIEQLYPYPDKQLEDIFKKYEKAQISWVQEEPENMGPWRYMYVKTGVRDLKCIARKSSASPATGYKKVHDDQSQQIIEEAFNG